MCVVLTQLLAAFGSVMTRQVAVTAAQNTLHSCTKCISDLSSQVTHMGASPDSVCCTPGPEARVASRRLLPWLLQWRDCASDASTGRGRNDLCCQGHGQGGYQGC